MGGDACQWGVGEDYEDLGGERGVYYQQVGVAELEYILLWEVCQIFKVSVPDSLGDQQRKTNLIKSPVRSTKENFTILLP